MPQLFILAGCNGAGKTTTAKILLPEFLGGIEFVNADIIAAQLNPEFPESVAFQAGRIMLERVDVLLSEKSSFALETTLATKSYVGLTKKAQSLGYEVVLMYFWLESYDIALKRVAKRVREGGHFIPDEDVKRRYEGGIRNLVDLFIPVVNHWSVHDNSDYNLGTPKLIARDEKDGLITIVQPEIWTKIQSYGNKR
jgi:predicted ABC-type ATPase